jgi:NAD(P)-dependent dehydrogenase (short-subunit alcohol dehydrogenase family)
MGRVARKGCIVTGGSRGIGAATSRLLASEGASVLLTDVREEEGEAVAASISATGGKAIFMRHDVANEQSWSAVFEVAVKEFGRVDVLVNNAGIHDPSPPEEQTLERWHRLMSINLDGVVLGCKHAIQAMKINDPKGGSIINISSVLGLVGGPRAGAYCASKGGVALYTKSAALYCAQQRLGIRVNSVHPGYIWTPLLEDHLKQRGDVEVERKSLEAVEPIGHLGEPNDVAYGILYLASDEAKFVTGSGLVIDGGYTAQ